MDDTADKLRRNVVALSAAILAIAVLNLQFTPTGTVLGIATLTNLVAWKVWICLSVALLYVFLRYRFDSETKEAMAKTHVEFSDFIRDSVNRTGARALERYLRDGRPARWVNALDTVKEGRWQQDCDAYGQPDWLEALAQTVSVGDNKWKGTFRYSIGAKWQAGGAEWARSGGYLCPFEVSPGHRALITALAAGRAIYSKGAIDVAVPFAAAAAAGFVCLFKLGFSLGAIR